MQLTGHSGHPHPALLESSTTRDVRKLCHHWKFLTGDFLTAKRQALDEPHLNPACKLCSAPVESLEHVLVSCRVTSEARERIYPQLMNVLAEVQPNSLILEEPNSPHLTQFILDCSSINLGEGYRVPAHNPGISRIFSLSRD